MEDESIRNDLGIYKYSFRCYKTLDIGSLECRFMVRNRRGYTRPHSLFLYMSDSLDARKGGSKLRRLSRDPMADLPGVEESIFSKI